MWAYDANLQRCNVFDLQLRFVRYQRCAFSFVAEARSNGGQLVIQGDRVGRDALGYHVHLASGNELVSFVEDSAFNVDRDRGTTLPIATGASDSVWIGRLPRSQAMHFELWTTENSLARTLDRRGRAWVGYLVSLYVDGRGSLWSSFSRQPDSVQIAPFKSGEPYEDFLERQRSLIGRRETTIEVIDPVTGALLATASHTRSDAARFMDNGEIYVVARSGDDLDLLILRPRMVPAN